MSLPARRLTRGVQYELENNGSRIVGVVLNRVKKNQVDYSDYGYDGLRITAATKDASSAFCYSHYLSCGCISYQSELCTQFKKAKPLKVSESDYHTMTYQGKEDFIIPLISIFASIDYTNETNTQGQSDAIELLLTVKKTIQLLALPRDTMTPYIQVTDICKEFRLDKELSESCLCAWNKQRRRLHVCHAGCF